jgi:thioredoxin reductase/ferredoxin
MPAEPRTLLQRYTHWLHTRWPAGTVEKLPEVEADFSTAVPGVYIVGDLTGVPLLKLSADSGARVVDDLVADPRFAAARRDRPRDVAELLIVGAGVAGMAAALQAQQHGLDFVIVEAAQPFATVVNFPRGKPIYTYPKDLVPRGRLPLHAPVKEELLAELNAQTAAIKPLSARVEQVRRRGEVLICTLAGDGHGGAPRELTALRVILAIGRSGNFRRLGVPGEDLDKVYNRLHDPRDFAGKKALVVGGGDSAAEAAIALVQGGAEVTLSYRKPELARPKPDNLERLAALLRDPGAPVTLAAPSSERVTTATGRFATADRPTPPGSLRLLLPSTLREIRAYEVDLVGPDGAPQTLANDVVFSMIGREPPLEFLRRSRLRIAGETSPLGWALTALLIAACVFIYSWKSGGPTERYLDPGALAARLAAHASDRSTLLGTLAVSLKSRSFYYTLLYTGLIVVFGLQRIARRKTPYVRWQTLTLIAVQALPLFLLPEIILPWLGYNGVFSHGLGKTVADHLFEPYISDAAYAAGQWPDWGHPRAYWRAYGFILAWPLSVYNVFTDQPMPWWLGISFVQTFVLIPLLVWRWGKGAFCGWICSCGALAETMGDKQREKMPHGPEWNRLNMLGQAILALAAALLLIRVAGWLFPASPAARVFHLLLEGKNARGQLTTFLCYKWVVDILLGGILGVGLYFKYSGRMWCRLACPLAALMHIYARFSRFRIFADKKKCISCNVCTSVCHMGIDVMNFANKGLPMQDPECVRCSACVQSCPTGVLSFGVADAHNQPRRLDRLPASLVQIRENPAAKKPAPPPSSAAAASGG